jgi:hypothetical protein
VHLQTAQPQIFQFARAGINALDLLQRDAKFVFIGAGGDFGVGAASTPGFTRTATGAIFLSRAAMRLMRCNSGSLSALKE